MDEVLKAASQAGADSSQLTAELISELCAQHSTLTTHVVNNLRYSAFYAATQRAPQNRSVVTYF